MHVREAAHVALVTAGCLVDEQLERARVGAARRRMNGRGQHFAVHHHHDLALAERPCGVGDTVEVVRKGRQTQLGVRLELLEAIARLGLQLDVQPGLGRRDSSAEHLRRSPLLEELDQLLARRARALRR